MKRTTTTTPESKGPITSDTGRFAMVPLWVLDALQHYPARCAGAVLLYARLSAEADYGTTGDLTITQGDLAARCCVSVDTLQRTLGLLRDIGAVTWRAEGRAATYTVRRAMPTCRTSAAGQDPEVPHPCGSSDRTRAASATAGGPRIPTTPEVVQNTPENPPTPQGGTVALTDPFGAFWQAYPRRVGRPPAERAFRRIGPSHHARVMAGLDAWCAYWAARNEPEYVPHPSTWLNQRRWEDAPPPLPASRRTGTVQATVDVGRDVLATLAARQAAAQSAPAWALEAGL